jgi:snurportin-1
LEYFFASTTSISSIDGYLFYHKDGLYISDTTPLVCWLKPFMIPEILKIPVGGDFVKGKPSGYSTLAEYVKMLEEKHPKKPRRKFRDHSEETMETEENSDDPVLC